MQWMAISTVIGPMPLVDVDRFNVPAFSVSEDRDGVLRYDGFNAAGAAMTGMQPSDWIGREPHERLPAAMAERVSACYRRCLCEGVVVEYEDEFEQPAGRLWWRTTVVPVLDQQGGVAGLIGFGTNVTARKQAEAELHDAAFVDPLTGAANRRGFEHAFEKVVSLAAVGGEAFTVVIADVDQFKSINDLHGHAVGDRVLAKVALRLRNALGDTTTIARIGGDEFAIIGARGPHADSDASALLVKIESLLASPLALGDMHLTVGVSLGEARWRQGMSGRDLLAEADARMYARKRGNASMEASNLLEAGRSPR